MLKYSKSSNTNINNNEEEIATKDNYSSYKKIIGNSYEELSRAKQVENNISERDFFYSNNRILIYKENEKNDKEIKS